MQISILTLNLAGFKDWAAREPSVVQALGQTDADIVLLQEVMYDSSISPLTQANLVNSLLERPYLHTISDVSRLYVRSSGEQYREGLAVLSRFVLQNPETLALTKAPDDKHTRLIQNVDAVIGSAVLSLTNVHFSNNTHSADQLRETLGILKNRDRDSVIAGDFNIFHINDVRPTFDDEYTASTDVAPYISFLSENVTLDYILLPKQYRFVRVATIETASDHLGVIATIEFSPHKKAP